MIMKKILLLIICVLITDPAFAITSGSITQLNSLDAAFINEATSFEKNITKYATSLFWILATISLAWTAIEMGLKRAEFGEIVAELCKFIIVTGLFWYFVTNGTTIAYDIADSLTRIAQAGTGKSGGNLASSTNIFQNTLYWGLIISDRVFEAGDELGMSDILPNLTIFATAILIIFIFIFIGLKLLILKLKIICQIYAGCFFLGFGGCKWTRDTTINYFRSVIGSAAQFFAILLICAVLNTLCVSDTTTGLIENVKKAVEDDGSVFEACCALIMMPVSCLFIAASLPGAIGGLFSGNIQSANQNAAQTLTKSMSNTARAVTSPTARTIARNIPGSQLASKAAGGVWNAVRHPVKTAGAASNWMARAVGQYKGSKQARKEANANLSQSKNNRSNSNNSVKEGSDIKNSQSNSKSQAKSSGDNSVKDASKQQSVHGQNQNTSNPDKSAASAKNSGESPSGTDSSLNLSKNANGTESNSNSNSNSATSNDLTPESAVTPDAVLKEAKELFNSGHCSQKAEENALDTAQNLANDPNVPDSVRQQANDLGNEILRNKEVNSFNRASSGGDTSNRTNDEATANQQKYQAQSKNWSSDSNTPMGMLNQAKGLYKSGTASKADEQKALMTALNLASDKNIPQFVRDEAQKLSTTIQQESDANATRRSSHGIGNTAMTQQDIEQYSQSINSAKSGFYKSGTSVQNNSSGSNSSLSPLNELKSSQVSQSPENRKTDIDNSSQNKSAVNQSQNKLNQSQSANSKQNNKPDNTKSDNRHINQIEIGDTAQNQERAALAKKNSETLGALWDATGGRGLRFINDHQPFHMITSYRAGHEMARERTEQKLASNKRE